MTCGTHVCCICEAPRVMRRDWRGRFTGGKTRVVRQRSPYYTDGHLTNGKNLKGKPTLTPHREFCPGCLANFGLTPQMLQKVTAQ